MANTINDDARRTADDVVRRERRRIRTLGVLAIGLWVLAALLIASVYLPIGAKLKHYGKTFQAGAPPEFTIDQDRPQASAPVPTTQEIPAVVADLRRQQWAMGEIIIHEWIVGAMILTFALATGVLASIATVWLSLTIRRVTMRQVGEQLAQISEQLRQLQRGST